MTDCYRPMVKEPSEVFCIVCGAYHAQDYVCKYDYLYKKVGDVNALCKSLEKRIEKIESSSIEATLLYVERQTRETWQKGCETLINNLQKKIEELERFQDVTHRQYQNNIQKKQPYVCPVCNGNAKSSSSDLKIYLCFSCNGTGIVWN